MSVAFTSSARGDPRPFYLAIIAGLACSLAIGKSLPLAMNAAATAIGPLCASSEPERGALDKVEPIASYPLANVPGVLLPHRLVIRRSA